MAGTYPPSNTVDAKEDQGERNDHAHDARVPRTGNAYITMSIQLETSCSDKFEFPLNTLRLSNLSKPLVYKLFIMFR